MKLEQVLPAFREGRGIKRKRWDYSIDKVDPGYEFDLVDLLSDDWEIVGEENHIADVDKMVKEDKRGIYAAMCLQGIIARGSYIDSPEVTAKYAVEYTNALIKELEK